MINQKTILTAFLCATAALFMQPQSLKAATSSKKDIKKLLGKRNILTIPSLSSQISTYTVKSSKVSTLATPPTLKSIAALSVAPSSIKSVFWREIDGVNVIDALNSGNTSAQYCNEFFAGTNDGESGGLGACHLAESVGFSYSNIVRGGVPLCFIKSLPTKSNSAGITVNSGSYPSGNIEKLFSTPEGSTARIVKVNTTGGISDENTPKTTFIEVPSAASNKQGKKLYSANIWHCNGNNEVIASDNISISNSLLFTVKHSDKDHGQKVISLTGFLEKDGNNLDWNAAKSRTASTAAQEANSGDGVFKTDIEITKSNLIKLKRLDNFNQISKSYQISSFSGSDAEDLRFLTGAFNEIHGDRTLDAGIDFPSTFFAIDINNAFKSDVNSEDLNSGFYTSGLELDFDLSSYSCVSTPDIEITADVGSETLKNTIGKCQKEAEGLQNMHFCHDDVEVAQAEENFKNFCVNLPQPTQGPPPTPSPKPTKQPPPRP